MARKKRLSPNQLADLKDDFAGLKTIQDYAPAKNEFTGSQHDAMLSCSLEAEVLSYEGELIRRALATSGGSVTRAARLLGITHQGLAFILNGRHKSLLTARKPVKPRRRSIIRYH